MTRKKEVFKTLKPKEVKIYTCGQTVYDELHVGNAKTYGIWDIIVRYLRFKDYDVFHVQNFTDVGHLTDDGDEGEDKIEKRARLKRIEPMELVDQQIREYWLDIDELNIARPNISPRATQHIIEMQELIKKLLSKGYAYEVSGNVYFNTSKFKDYGKLARLSLKDLKAGARVEIDPNKNHPRDFALWLKAPSKHIMKWSSPWSIGYPGWHLECSVMAMKYLGDTIDVHGGGIDHIPVHHTNEIAQSEAVTGKTYSKYWLHNAFITINGEKMSKSKGNFITARDAINKWGAMVVRLALASGHYRSQIDYNNGLLTTAKNNLERVRNTIEHINNASPGRNNELLKIVKAARKAFIEAMDDDFNTPKALAVIYAFIKKVNKSINKASNKSLNASKDLIIKLMGVLGVDLTRKEEAVELTDDLIKLLIRMRDEARKRKDYKISDRIRLSLKKLGVIIEDSPKGSRYKIINP